MTGDDALRLVESLLQESPLSKLQAIVLKQTWDEKSYLEIARSSGYEVGYVRQAGSQLWQLLSRALGQRVSKNNLRFVLQRYARQTQPGQAELLRRSMAEPPLDLPQVDWGEATDITVFYGRTTELDQLTNWIVQDKCRLVGIFGMGGMGKTCLSIKLVTQIQHQFEFVVWRSLRNAPSIQGLLADLVQFLSDHQETSLPEDLDGRILRLLHYLRQHRCLVILDNSETIIQEGDRDGNYLPGYEGYGQLLRCVGEMVHQSCVLLTSREKPRGFATKEGAALPIRSLPLAGLEFQAGQQLLALKGAFTGTPQDWQTLISHYAGNPLALKMVAPAIQDFFEGDVARFLEMLGQGTTVFGDIRGLLAQQLARLSDLEDQVITWLAVNRELITLAELQADFLPPLPLGDLLEALISLERRCILERRGAARQGDQPSLFTLQPVVMEYVTEHLINRVCQELIAWEGATPGQSLQQLSTHALLKAQAKDYIREIQQRFILQPILGRLLALDSAAGLTQKLQSLLRHLQKTTPQAASYMAGNLVNLLAQLPADLRGYDLSNLTIWQAYLSQVNLQGVQFTHSDLSRSVFKETFSQILSVAFSPDGTLVAASDVSHEIRIWQVTDGRQIFHQQVEDGWVWSVTFSPDGRTLASSANRAVKLWDVTTGQCQQVFQGYTGRIFSLSFSPDGRYLATGSEDQVVSLWDLQTGGLVQTLTGHRDEVRSVAFSPIAPSSQQIYLLASGSSDRTIRLWTLAPTTGWACQGVLAEHQEPVWTVAFSPDGKLLASGSSDRSIKLWDMTVCPAPQTCLGTLQGHTQRIRTLAFSQDGDILVSGSDDQSVRLWDWQTGECLRSLQGHSSWISAVACAPAAATTSLGLGSCLIASGSEDQSLRLWDGQTSRCLRTLQGHSNGIWSVTFNPAGNLLASGGQDRRVRLWDVQTGQHLQSWSGHSNWVWSVAFSPDGTLVASGSEDRTIRLWQVTTGTCVHRLQGHGNAVLSVAFSPDGQWLASGSLDGTVKLWSVVTGACLITLEGHQSGVWTVAFSPDGQAIASGSQDKTIKIWRYHGGGQTGGPGAIACQTLTHHRSWIRCVVFAPGRQPLHLASGSSDGVVNLWNGETGDCERSLMAHASPVLSTVFSPDAQVLATSGADATIHLWDAHTGQHLRPLVGHEKWVRFLSYHPQGHQLASCSQDETIRVWDAATGTCLALLRVPRPYEGMDITQVTGLTGAQKVTLKALGAIEQVEPD